MNNLFYSFYNFVYSVIIGFVSVMIYYRNYAHKITFDSINKNYKKKIQWEHDLDIYQVAMPRFFTSGPKKKRCILFIGGYRDIPYVWNEIEQMLISDGYDFYAPRTFGMGRSFFQNSSWKDWVITYIEAMYILGEQYESVDIVSFSAGTIIALYLSQFNYKCKINNIFLCAPILLYQTTITINLLFSNNIFSYILNQIYTWTLRFHPKIKNKFSGFRDTHNVFHSINDYCEIFGDLQTDTTLFDLFKQRPKYINASKIIILYPNDDDVIGDIYEQQKIITDIFNKPVDLITIPTYLNDKDNQNNNDNYVGKAKKCGHVMFKEHPEIILNIYENIVKYLGNE